MKPDPEALEDETTPDTAEEIRRAGSEFYQSVEFDKPVDWRQMPDEEEDDE